MNETPDIQVEKDIPYSQAEAKRQPKTREPHPLEPKLRAMAHGDSFFIAGLESKDVSYITRLGDRIGVYLQAKTLKKDGQLEGVRTWRRQLDQLAAKRREKIEAKIAAGEFDREDLSAVSDSPAPEAPPTQDENVGDLYWLHTEENRYYRTRAGEDITWMRDNCQPVDAEEYFDRPRYWVYPNGVKPVCTRVRTTADSLEESDLAEEVTETEYTEAMDAWCTANPDVKVEMRYFENTKTGTKMRADSTVVKRYLDAPDTFVEISEAEYNGETFDDL